MLILLTGASGFIGSYFQKHYASEYQYETFSFSQHSCDELILNHIEIILHLAAVVHQPIAQEEEYFQINVQKTLKFARKAKEEGVRHFIFMSTIAVYDETLKVVAENSQCFPATYYGKSKLEAEKQLLALSDENFKVSIVRPPMVYGFIAPGNIKSLMRLIAKVSILPFGSINNKRSFIYVGNLCALIYRIIQTGKDGIFLASDDRSLSTTELITLIASAMHKKVYLLEFPFFPLFLRWLKPSLYKRLFESLEVDNTKTKHFLNFQNPYSVEEGIRLMVQGYKA